MAKDTHVYATAQTDDQQLEASKEALITQCFQVATSYARRYKHCLNHSEIGDLVGEAMLAITEKVEEASSKENPLAWLVSVGKHAMIEYLSTQDTLISHNHRHQNHTMLRLDIPYNEKTVSSLLDTLAAPASLPEEQDYTVLYEAIGQLSPKRKQLVEKRFGLNGCPETQLKDMAATRREQQKISKALAGAKRTLAAYLEAKQSIVA